MASPRTTPVRAQSSEAESSYALVHRARGGDSGALDALCARYAPRLWKWAHGRVPQHARGAFDTHDLVQDTLIQVVRRLDTFEPRHEGAFRQYVWETLTNRIRDIARWQRRRGTNETLTDAHPARNPSPLEDAIGTQALARYKAAMSRLRSSDREIIIAKVELGLPYPEIAAMFGKPSVAAAHMAVSRALVRLAREMAVAQTG